MKTGIIDAGGGLRGIYAAGVLDSCLDKGIGFDVCIGVSAGSANLASFTAGQSGRNYRSYHEYAFRKEYMSIGNFIKKRSYVDLDYIYSVLSNSDGEDPFDYDAFMSSSTYYAAVATNALTGNPMYFDKSATAQDRYDVFKASSAIPFVCRPVYIDGIPYYDGALSDPLPIDKAFELGCEKVIVLLTRQRDYIRKSTRDEWLAKGIRREFPVAAAKFCKRADKYNAAVRYAKECEARGNVLIIAPDSTKGLGTLTKDKDALHALYEKGLTDASRIHEFLNI